MLSVKSLLLIAALLFSWTYLGSQELYLGGAIGTGFVGVESPIMNSSVKIEYSPLKAMVSFNGEVAVMFSKGNTVATIPLYMKVLVGNRFRISPAIGGFIRSNLYFGILLGLHLDYQIKPGLRICARGDLYNDFWYENYPSHIGEGYRVLNSLTSHWLSIGLKKNLKNYTE